MQYIGLVQINNSFAGAGYFPYSIGLLQAYYKKFGEHISDTIFLEPVFERCAVSDACSHLADACLVGFSTYAWNF